MNDYYSEIILSLQWLLVITSSIRQSQLWLLVIAMIDYHCCND